MSSQVRYYLQVRDNKILELWMGSKNRDPLAPKEISLKLGLKPWVVYQRLSKLKKMLGKVVELRGSIDFHIEPICEIM